MRGVLLEIFKRTPFFVSYRNVKRLVGAHQGELYTCSANCLYSHLAECGLLS